MDVQKSGDVVLHKLAQPGGLARGDLVRGRVDMLRRLAHARHHTATHLVHDSAKRILGKHVWQAGAQKSEERARLDISHFKRISDAELKAIELEANRRVMELTPVDTQFLPALRRRSSSDSSFIREGSPQASSSGWSGWEAILRPVPGLTSPIPA